MDLFAGCGGLSLGLEMAGFKTAYVNELNEDAMASFLLNRHKKGEVNYLDEFSSSDVKDLVNLGENGVKSLIKKMGETYGFDPGHFPLISGGPPCQGFSGIGHRRSYSVSKEEQPSNHLFQDMAWLVNVIRPMAFLFENVRGLLSAKWNPDSDELVWEDVRGTFGAREGYEGFQGGGVVKGYKVRYKLLKAKDYGVAQNRPRVIMVGIKDEVFHAAGLKDVPDPFQSGVLPSSIGSPPPGIKDLLGDLVDDSYENGGSSVRYPAEPANEYQRAFRKVPSTGKILGKGCDLQEQDYSKHSEKTRERFQFLIDNEGKGPLPPHLVTKKFAQRWLPPTWEHGGRTDGPFITATSLPDDYVHFCQPRTLTVREWARLQGFPDWYQFAGKRTTGGTRRAGNPRKGIHDREVPKYTQIGNAVPVPLAYELGRHLAGIIRRAIASGKPLGQA